MYRESIRDHSAAAVIAFAFLLAAFPAVTQASDWDAAEATSGQMDDHEATSEDPDEMTVGSRDPDELTVDSETMDGRMAESENPDSMVAGTEDLSDHEGSSTDLSDLTVVTYGGPDAGILCATGRVKRLIYGFVSLDSIPLEPHFRKARQAGSFRASELDEGMLQWGLYAAATRTDLNGKPEAGWYPEETLRVEDAISACFGVRSAVHGSGRTDRGVHALVELRCHVQHRTH